ncbi:endochitinase A-like [Drosophila miranda]|uniref:endochitinase A-like n=1 Tax=Drosophila miranda TaxID=7229 RepID=UPI0007E6D797|nr:endochitinase A-like [Drosophila miranda]
MCLPFISKPFRRNKRNRNRGPTPTPSVAGVEGAPVGQVAEVPTDDKVAEQVPPIPAEAPEPAPEMTTTTTTATSAAATAALTQVVQTAQSPAAMAIALAASFAATGRPSKTLSTITSVNSMMANSFATTLQVQEPPNAAPATSAVAPVDGEVPATASTASASGRKKTWMEWFGMSKKKSSIDSL